MSLNILDVKITTINYMYLSDQIFIDIPNEGTYLNYTLNFCKPDWYNTNISNKTVLGRVFSYKDGQKLYLNDLLSTYADNYSWMSYDNVYKFNKMIYGNAVYKIQLQPLDNAFTRIIHTIGSTTGYTDVALWFDNKRTNAGTGLDMSWFTNSKPEGFTLLSKRTKILPRIPKLYLNATNFFIGASIAINRGWMDYSSIDGDRLFRIVALDKDKNLITDDDGLSQITYEPSNGVMSMLIGGYLTAGSSPGVLDNTRFKYLAVAPVHGTGLPPQWDDISNNIIIAEYDTCNADYYLIWCDRTGGYQCQPFSKNSTLTEDIATSTLINSYDEERPYLKSITNKWTLNSDWLSFDEYQAYESIFTSPYTYLFDTKFNELTPVICTDKTWSEKTNKNTKKPFNLKITVTENRKQNILY